MKKAMLFILCFAILSFGFTAYAQEELYHEQFEQSGAGELSDFLSVQAKEILNDLEVDPQDQNWASRLTVQNIFQAISGFLKDNGRSVLLSCISVLGVVLLSFCFESICGIGAGSETISYVSILGICTFLLLPIFSTVTAVTTAIQSGCVFMLSFIPVFVGILISGGQTATSTGFSALMLGATEAINWVVSFIVLPLTGMHLALSVTSAVSPLINTKSIAGTIKKVATWVLSFSLLLFLGILKIQTVVGSATDSISLSATKFVVGTTVPLVGSAVGEAISTVKGCVSLLGNSVGMYGVIGVFCSILPVGLQLILWRIGVLLTATVSELFECKKISDLLRSVDTTLSFLLAVLACIAVFFVISITTVTVGGGKI